jgi:hypothetical protein
MEHVFEVAGATPGISAPGTYAAIRTPRNGRLYLRVYNSDAVKRVPDILRPYVLYLVRVKGRQNDRATTGV